jgi:predicted metal-binding protein
MTAAPIVYVCVTCRPVGEPNSAVRPGAILAAAATSAAAGTEVEVRPMRCLGNCSRGPTAALRCNGSWTYVFGGLDPANADALIEGARMLAGAADGILPWRGRPAPLKRGMVARVPPIGFTETDE